ncbi:MAG: hypothetical protein ABIP03_06600 [Aquihabitans sp.]
MLLTGAGLVVGATLGLISARILVAMIVVVRNQGLPPWRIEGVPAWMEALTTIGLGLLSIVAVGGLAAVIYLSVGAALWAIVRVGRLLAARSGPSTRGGG